MQQPLAHLYFICVFECLSQESLSFLTLAADKSAKVIKLSISASLKLFYYFFLFNSISKREGH